MHMSLFKKLPYVRVVGNFNNKIAQASFQQSSDSFYSRELFIESFS